ncbi:hypothetical protein TNCV_26001 [Trichonephila clavipes]|uniref:Uncharacterized protein n=1 Tax=Trichonephila clavipes TaxID=2585209 RepID=A0A8X7BCB2_TRICX|nr:hypothetical protein TNCV_26001 [Trichonephila clavipes]
MPATIRYLDHWTTAAPTPSGSSAGNCIGIDEGLEVRRLEVKKKKALDSLASSSAFSLPRIFTWAGIHCSIFFVMIFVDGLDDFVTDLAFSLLDGL